jgi:outer membrane protein TolC
MPVFHGGALLHQRRAAVQAYERALADYRQAVLAAFAQVADTLAALANDAESLRALADAVTAARQAVDLLQANYRSGLVSYLAVLVADVQLNRAQVDFLQARAVRLQDTVALYLALGGGWWALPPQVLEKPDR